jgi:hypothetical protein
MMCLFGAISLLQIGFLWQYAHPAFTVPPPSRTSVAGLTCWLALSCI